LRLRSSFRIPRVLSRRTTRQVCPLRWRKDQILSIYRFRTLCWGSNRLTKRFSFFLV